jgi:4,5-dihydroxyphthalate decarboxylase
MSPLSLQLAGYPWDHITPLLTGEVTPEDIDLTYDVGRGLAPVANDPATHGGEASLGRFFIDTSRGNRDFIGLPIFPMFQLRHRCFLVKRGTQIEDLARLEGKRIGIDGWPNSGNTWTRIVLQQAGVDISNITWVIAPVEGAPDDGHGRVPSDAPSNVEAGPPGKSLVDLLASGEIDVLVTAFMPAGYFEHDSPIVPMIPDVRAAETAYVRQHGYVPAHHLIKLRREIVEANPWIVESLTTAFEASKQLWIERRRRYADTSPWLLAELSEAAAVFGDDWQPIGLAPNLQMLTDFAEGQHSHGLVQAPVDPAATFSTS